ncbi:helix-turn-helix transcriptional regulator [uncultured Clostridium sp.]|uniref:helix-turn-helix transcriptional regulator n=1 Tax=uncultured Clostridium sp. TaxID=59620 RepID=UPI0037DDD477
MLYRCNWECICYQNTQFKNDNSTADKLKYYRLKSGLTQNQLADIVGFSNGSCIKDIEIGRKLPGRNISKKLAAYFKLDTKYFFDKYLESTDTIKLILKDYREKHNLTIKQVSNKFNISQTAWQSWESGNNYPSRSKYELLKKYNIL